MSSTSSTSTAPLNIPQFGQKPRKTVKAALLQCAVGALALAYALWTDAKGSVDSGGVYDSQWQTAEGCAADSKCPHQYFGTLETPAVSVCKPQVFNGHTVVYFSLNHSVSSALSKAWLKSLQPTAGDGLSDGALAIGVSLPSALPTDDQWAAARTQLAAVRHLLQSSTRLTAVFAVDATDATRFIPFATVAILRQDLSDLSADSGGQLCVRLIRSAQLTAVANIACFSQQFGVFESERQFDELSKTFSDLSVPNSTDFRFKILRNGMKTLDKLLL